MTIAIDIPDSKIESLSDQGLNKLKDFGQKYLNDIIDESGRIAVSRNTAGADPEITASIVADAELYCRKYRTGKKTSKKLLVFQILTYVFSLITGGFFNLDKLTTPGYLIFFLILFTIAISTGITSIILGGKND